ncbi:MAG: peptidase C39 family protein, partial [Planctomycetota bacterium]|nr:peptidase C39 family protein [Planctomycetota bacterium]
MRLHQSSFILFGLSIAAPLFAAGDPKVLDGVPDVVQKTDYSCGCAALQSVLAYWGIDLSEKQITKDAKVDPNVGAELEDLAKVAIAQGCVAVLKEKWTLKDLYKELKAKRPVIVLIQAWRENKKLAWKDDWDDGHYVVVIGMDRKNVYVEDPSLEDARGKIPLKEFVERW